MKKIINIIIFTVAGLSCLLALIFVGVYKDDKTLYDEVGLVKEKNPQIIEDFLSVTPDNLPEYIAENQKIANELAADLKEKQLPKDILYTYISNLSELTAETFPDFKNTFPTYSKSMLARGEIAKTYTDGFNAINEFSELNGYINTLNEEYVLLKQSYITDKEHLRALNSFLGRTSLIAETVSKTKQSNQILELQEAIVSSTKAAKLLNLSIAFFYVTLFAAIVFAILFALFQIFANIKQSYQVFIAIAIMAILIFIAYLVSSSDLTASAIKMGLTSSQIKMIGAGVITCYVFFFAAILSIIISWIINLFKKI